MVCRRRSAPASSRRPGGMAEGSGCADCSASVSIRSTRQSCQCVLSVSTSRYRSLSSLGKVGGWPPSRHEPERLAVKTAPERPRCAPPQDLPAQVPETFSQLGSKSGCVWEVRAGGLCGRRPFRRDFSRQRYHVADCHHDDNSIYYRSTFSQPLRWSRSTWVTPCTARRRRITCSRRVVGSMSSVRRIAAL